MKVMVGNIILLIAAIIMIISGVLKTKKEVLGIQVVQIIVEVIGNCVLGSYPGMINCLLESFRNFLEYHKKLTSYLKGIIVVISMSLTLCFNTVGVIGLLPALACVLFTIFMSTENIVAFKTLTIGTMLLWTIHDFYIMAYTAAIFDILYILANIISIIKIQKAKKKEDDKK